ncbi:hypothetical protein APR12_001704 [Nocardia amikacinitolerans]|nr:hypothetical protein [Nocardia amikacinitolerans]
MWVARTGFTGDVVPVETTQEVAMLNLVSVPNSPIEALLRTLSLLMCSLSSGEGCAVIQ